MGKGGVHYPRRIARADKGGIGSTKHGHPLCIITVATDESVEEIVGLASTLGLTSAGDNPEENEYFYGDDSTNWSEQHYMVCFMYFVYVLYISCLSVSMGHVSQIPRGCGPC